MTHDLIYMIIIIFIYLSIIFGILYILYTIKNIKYYKYIFENELKCGDQYQFDFFGLNSIENEIFEVIGKEKDKIIYFNIKDPNKILRTNYILFLYGGEKI